jgi:hypothetical protein
MNRALGMESLKTSHSLILPTLSAVSQMRVRV